MSTKTITLILRRDCVRNVLELRLPHRLDFTYHIDIPRVDLRQWKDARMEITISENDEEP